MSAKTKKPADDQAPPVNPEDALNNKPVRDPPPAAPATED